jgi:general secretion pathway protein A
LASRSHNDSERTAGGLFNIAPSPLLPTCRYKIEKVPQPVSDVILQDPGSLTYEPYFGLREKPFSLSPDPRFFFRNPAHGATFDALLEGIRRREGILMLTGEVGTGKTTLCRAVLQALDRKTFAAFVADPFLSREDLLKTLLVDFGVVSVDDIRGGKLRGASRTDLSYPLYEFLASLQPLQAFAVVMIDEAQNLPTQLLEEIRILSDLENRQKLLEVVLVGQPELQSRLATSVMRQLSQRVTTRCELPPFARTDLRPYVSHRLTIAGGNGTVQFTADAIDQVWAASHGIPRIINLVCDRALFHAARCRTLSVDAEHIVRAIDDLKLPLSQGPSVQPGSPLESFPLEWPEASLPEILPSAMAVDEDLWTTLDSQIGETQEDGLAETPALERAVPEDSGSTRRRRARWVALVTAALAVTTVAGYRYSMSRPPPPGQSSVSVQPSPSRGARSPGESVNPTSVAGAPADVAVPAREQAPARSQNPVPRRTEATRFVLQMATFQSAERAARALQEFRDGGYQGYTVEVSLHDGGRAVAVFLGPYAELAPAERDLQAAQQIPGYGGGRIVQVGPRSVSE